jgi:hypothetical protein
MQQHAGGMVTDQWGTANAGTGPAPDLGLIPLTIPELLRLLSGTVIPQPRPVTRPTVTAGPPGDDTTSTWPAGPTSAGTPTPTRHRDHELQLP